MLCCIQNPHLNHRVCQTRANWIHTADKIFQKSENKYFLVRIKSLFEFYLSFNICTIRIRAKHYFFSNILAPCMYNVHVQLDRNRGTNLILGGGLSSYVSNFNAKMYVDAQIPENQPIMLCLERINWRSYQNFKPDRNYVLPKNAKKLSWKISSVLT